MAVNLSKHGAALSEVYDEVVNGRTDTDWVLFTYEGNSNDIQVAAKGSGGLNEMVQELNAGKVMYVFCRVTDPNSGVPKFILINWTGEGVTGMRRGVCANHLHTMGSFLRGAHVRINAHSKDDVEPELIMNKVSQAVGVHYSEQTGSNQFKNTAASSIVGSVYRKTKALEEIKGTEREKFWAQMQREEETRRQQERKKAEEERQRAERERKEQEERETAERERRQRERAKQINQQRLFEKRQETQHQNQQKQEPVERELQAAEWKGVRSSISGSKYSKTNALEEINGIDRASFWAQLEKEEETRRLQERKKAEEARQRAERERKEQDERETAERERRQRERVKQINQQRVFEKRQQTQQQAQQKQEPVERELQAAEWKGIRSSISVQEANKEEETRRKLEQKKAEVERQRAESERKELEERETAEREQRQRERAKQINQQRLFEKSQETQHQKQQKQELVEQELQAAEWKGVRSSRSVQEANGSKYYKTNALEEINRLDRASFWAQLEKEEETRRQEERKKAEEKRQRAERERKELEERETAERERRLRERAKQINQQRLFEKKHQAQQKQEPVEREWKGVRSSRSVQQANGSKYCKTNALEEINGIDRTSFWAQLEKEEETLRQQEQKKAEEEQQRAERERKEQEERETAERERQQRARAKQIDQQRLQEKKQEATNINQQKLVEREPQAAEWKGIRSSRSVQEANDAAAIISQRAINPREIFSQKETNFFINSVSGPPPNRNSAENRAYNKQSYDKEELKEENIYDTVPSKVDDDRRCAVEQSDVQEQFLFAKALYDYRAADDTEITFDPGDIITVIEMADEGWWHGYGPGGHYGMFPANYVELV